MNNSKMIYDISTSDNAKATLAKITGISTDIFDYVYTKLSLINQYNFADKLCNKAIELGRYSYNTDVNEIAFKVQHITTSSDHCRNIKKNGIKNLYDTYKDTESELRKFLDENEIFIDLKNETITIEGKEHSIHYGVKDFGLSNLEENLWSIGRKFYYDFCICGFFSVNSYRAYGGYVHISPEILYNISKICKTDLRNKWAKNHSAYMVSFLANKDELIDTITHKENATDKEFLEGLIYCAVNNAYFSVDEYDVLLKDDVSIPTSRIIDISEFDIWE